MPEACQRCGSAIEMPLKCHSYLLGKWNLFCVWLLSAHQSALCKSDAVARVNDRSMSSWHLGHVAHDSIQFNLSNLGITLATFCGFRFSLTSNLSILFAFYPARGQRSRISIVVYVSSVYAFASPFEFELGMNWGWIGLNWLVWPEIINLTNLPKNR